MKQLFPILLLLASCSGQNDDDAASETSARNDAALASEPVLPTGEDAAAIQAKVSRAMALALPDAGSAQYRGVRAGAGGAACGEVAAGKGAAAGAFRPFVVTPDGIAVIAPGAAIDWQDPDDFVADAWIRWCATPEELQRLGPQLQSAAINSAAAAAAAAAPAADEPDLPLPPVLEQGPGAAEPAPAPAEKAAPPPARKSEAPPPRIDSFFNSVDRGN